VNLCVYAVLILFGEDECLQYINSLQVASKHIMKTLRLNYKEHFVKETSIYITSSNISVEIY